MLVYLFLQFTWPVIAHLQALFRQPRIFRRNITLISFFVRQGNRNLRQLSRQPSLTSVLSIKNMLNFPHNITCTSFPSKHFTLSQYSELSVSYQEYFNLTSHLSTAIIELQFPLQEHRMRLLPILPEIRSSHIDHDRKKAPASRHLPIRADRETG